jgi:uncharacterized membrane protein YdfJ with MMPL/SSD domain
VLVDATIVRILLVPATIRILGDWNWWPGGRKVTFRAGRKSPLGTDRRIEGYRNLYERTSPRDKIDS